MAEMGVAEEDLWRAGEGEAGKDWRDRGVVDPSRWGGAKVGIFSGVAVPRDGGVSSEKPVVGGRSQMMADAWSVS
jgi:hypothetical protein